MKRRLGFLNAILFWSYSLVVDLCADFLSIPRDNLAVPFAAGCFAGVCVCFISVPIELVKVQAQTSEESSLEIFRRIANEQGLLGFCQGGLVTLLRDSIGYGFYFLAYDGLSELLCTSSSGNIWGVLFAGGIAGCVSWFVIYPLDLVKTRLQSPKLREHRHLLPYEGHVDPQVQTGSQLTEMIDCFRVLYEEYGIIAFYRSLYIAMVRAFVVNAVIFWVNDWILTITSTA